MKTKVKQVDGLDARLQSSATAYTAGGTATAITLTVPGETYRAGLKLTFIASASNVASAKTINMNGLGAKNFYKPGGTLAPSITSGKAYNAWYDGTSFFLQASAEGDAVVANVLAGKTFSNDADTGLVGTMPNRAGDNAAIASSVNGTTLKLRAPEGYFDGVDDNVTLTDADFIAGNIKNGVNLFGLAGTMPVNYYATGTANTSGGSINVSGLSFRPKFVFVGITGTGGTPATASFVLANDIDNGASFPLICDGNAYYSIRGSGQGTEGLQGYGAIINASGFSTSVDYTTAHQVKWHAFG